MTIHTKLHKFIFFVFHLILNSSQISSCLFTEESLYQFFMPFGDVTDASIKESNVDEATGLQHGYGFVHFNSTPDGANSAFRAIMELTGDVFFSLHCEGSRNFMKQFHGNHATQIATQISRTKSAPTSLPRNVNTTYRNGPGSSKSSIKSNALYSDFNNKNGSPYFNQSMGSLAGPESMIYPPVPYVNSMGNIVPNSAYFYTSAGPYGPMPLSSPSVLLPPSAFSSQSNMSSFPLYDAYSPGYPFFPVTNQMPSHTHIGPALESYHGNYSSDPVPRAPGVPAAGSGRGRASLLNRSNNKSRSVLHRSKNIIHGDNDSIASNHLQDLQEGSYKLAVV